MEDFTFSKSTGEVYRIRPKQGFGWGIFLIDEATGTMSCISDYGDYSYRWDCHGCQSLKHFLTKIDTHFLLKKVGSENIEFKLEESVKEWKRHIVEFRRENRCSKNNARDAWKKIDSITEEYQDSNLIIHEMMDDENLSGIICWEQMVTTVRDYDAQAEAFANELWPMFINVLKSEMEPQETTNA